jgi:hypothetical protein
MEGIKYPKPCGDDVSPPGRVNDIVLFVLPYDSLLVTGHPSRGELFQK